MPKIAGYLKILTTEKKVKNFKSATEVLYSVLGEEKILENLLIC